MRRTASAARRKLDIASALFMVLIYTIPHQFSMNLMKGTPLPVTAANTALPTIDNLRVERILPSHL